MDADQVARQVVEPGEPALTRIAEEFGPEVIAADGTLDRAALGSIIFSDPEGRQRLNAITHPAVLDRSRALFAAAGEAVTRSGQRLRFDRLLLATGAAPRP